MTTATANDIREWARGKGYEMNERGRVPAHIRNAYNAEHPSMNGAPDYPPGMDDDDFSEPGAPPASAPPPPDTGEAKPRNPAKPAGKGWRFGGAAKGKRAAGRKAKPRVPVDDIICTVWRGLARVAGPLPPLQRTLRVQAPVAGLLLEDSVKGTVIDTVLQPLARMQTQGKAVAALAGPPMLVTAITLHVQRQALAGEDPNPVFMSVAMEMLRESLMLWMDVAGPKFEEALAREKRFEEDYGAPVDDFMAFLLSPPPADAAGVAAEEDAIKRAQGML